MRSGVLYRILRYLDSVKAEAPFPSTGSDSIRSDIQRPQTSRIGPRKQTNRVSLQGLGSRFLSKGIKLKELYPFVVVYVSELQCDISEPEILDLGCHYGYCKLMASGLMVRFQLWMEIRGRVLA